MHFQLLMLSLCPQLRVSVLPGLYHGHSWLKLNREQDSVPDRLSSVASRNLSRLLFGSLFCVQSRELSPFFSLPLSRALSLSLHAVYPLLPVPLSLESHSSSGSVTAHVARSQSVQDRTYRNRTFSVLREAAWSSALDSILLINGQSPLNGQLRYRHAISSKCNITFVLFHTMLSTWKLVK